MRFARWTSGRWVDEVLELEGVRCSVPGRTLFSGLTLGVRSGESVAIVGPSGVGKSTLLSAILGLTTVDEGRIIVAGTRMTGLKPSAAARVRREYIGVVFQDGELLPELSALENVAVAAMLASPDFDDAEARASALLESVGVDGDTPAADLSGGERQRTALARALVNSPALVLADEPTGSLDTMTRDRVADQLFETARLRGFALLLVTHDPTIATRASRVVNLGDYALLDQ